MRKKIMIFALIFIFLGGIIVGIYLRYTNYVVPIQVADSYLDMRYNLSYKENVNKRTSEMKEILSDTFKQFLMNTEQGGRFQKQYEKEKITSSILNKTLTSSFNLNEIKKVSAEVEILMKHELNKELDENIKMEISFILKKAKSKKYIIDYIQVNSIQKPSYIHNEEDHSHAEDNSGT